MRPPPPPTPWEEDPVQTVSTTLAMLTTVTWDEVAEWLVAPPILIIVTLTPGFAARSPPPRVTTRVGAPAPPRRAERGAPTRGGGPALQAVGVAQPRHVQRTQ